MFKTILLAYDGSDHARRALDIAAGLTRAFDAGLHIVVTPEPAMPAVVIPTYGTVIDVPPNDEEIARAGAEAIAQARALLEAAETKLADGHVRTGDAVSNIMEIADAINADLIIMGRRGLGAFKAFALGSVSQSVAHRAKVPCLTVA